MQTPIRELAPGSTFARRYQIIEDLGKGGMGRVYKVLDMEVREKLALKLLSPDIASDEQTIERFRNELKLARGISHRNICRMYDLGREEGSYFITMEYVPGEDLKSLIHRIGALPVGKAVSIARQICEGLTEAHGQGVVHRDLKPQNIMIDREGNARIMDFGIARSLKTKGITGGGVMIGTPEYMSPEQVDGKEADRRSDIYSLGIILFEMLTGRLPFEGDTPLSVAVKQKSEAPPDPRKFNAQIPEDLKRIILRCLDKSKDRRYQRAEEILDELAKIEKGLPATSQPLPVRKPLTSKQITIQLPSKKIWVPAGILLLLAMAFLVWQIIPQKQSSKRSVAVIGFKNQTGDRAFDYLQETIPNLLITSLEQSGHFRVTSWQRLQDLLTQTGKTGTAVLDEDTGFEICRKEGIEALVVGFYSKAGETFVTDVKVLDASTKQLLKAAQSKGEGPASVLKTQIDEISRNVSRGIGLPILKIEKSQPKIIDLTTNSLEAYNHYLLGRDNYEKFYYADARKFLEKAISLDPTFAIAYLYLSKASYALADFNAREEALKKAKQYSEKATEKERLFIEVSYAWVIERNPDKRFRLLEELAEKYPKEKDVFYELGSYYDNLKLYHEATKSKLKEIEPLLPGVDSANQEKMTFLYRLLEAEAALAENSVDQAIAVGEKIIRLNFLNLTTPNVAAYNMPFLKDILARAYWKKGDLDKAIAEYEKLITINRKNQVRYLIHPLYHYRLGRVYEEKGVRDKAVEQYMKFLVYWKDADEKIPEKADARQRIARLK
jgi:serine/threonine protein kinase